MSNHYLIKYIADMERHAKAVKQNDPTCLEPNREGMDEWTLSNVARMVSAKHNLDHCRKCWRLMKQGDGYLNEQGQLICEQCQPLSGTTPG